MPSQEVHNKLTDKEKFKLIEFYKRRQQITCYTGDNKKPKSVEKRGTSGGVW